MSAILVVDDERSIQESLSLILAEDGHLIDTAEDGLDALALLAEKKYDLVLTDLRMPRMDGMELLKTIRLQWGVETPVILISAYATETTVTEALNQGARDLVVKPFDIKTIRESVRYVLDKSPGSVEGETEKNRRTRIKERRLDHAMKKKIFEFSALDEIGKKVSHNTSSEKIGATILNMVQQIIKADRAFLVIYNLDREGYQYRCNYLKGQESVDSLTPSDEFTLEWLERHRRVLLVPDLKADEDFRDCCEAGSLLAVPFVRLSQVRGALILYRSGEAAPFDHDAQQFLSLLGSMTTTAIENADLYNELQSYFQGTVRALIGTLEAKDAFTYAHSCRVAEYAAMIGKQLRLNTVDSRRLEYLALLHDIGKIAVPETILRQKSKLTKWEQQIFETHVRVSENIVSALAFLPGGGSVVRSHHERFDGTGQPDGLRGEEIPLFARVITVANHFDMLTADYPGQPTLDPSRALETMIREASHAFDPGLLTLFIHAYRENHMRSGPRRRT